MQQYCTDESHCSVDLRSDYFSTIRPPAFYLSLLSLPLQLRISEMEMNKARNLIEHEEEIFSRPPRVWFQSKADLKRKSGKRTFKFEVLDSFNLRNQC